MAGRDGSGAVLARSRGGTEEAAGGVDDAAVASDGDKDGAMEKKTEETGIAVLQAVVPGRRGPADCHFPCERLVV